MNPPWCLIGTVIAVSRTIKLSAAWLGHATTRLEAALVIPGLLTLVLVQRGSRCAITSHQVTQRIWATFTRLIFFFFFLMVFYVLWIASKPLVRGLPVICQLCAHAGPYGSAPAQKSAHITSSRLHLSAVAQRFHKERHFLSIPLHDIRLAPLSASH